MLELVASALILGAGLKAIAGGGSNRKGRKNSNYKDAMGWSHDNHKKIF
ncbi:MAG: hypothetical protein SOZ07_06725 [Prevotella sp.]|nr:hypothetical protein [Prevotella sp.]